MARNKASAPVPTNLSELERKRLDAEGFLTFERLVDGKRVAAMRSRLESLLDTTEQSHAGSLIVGGLVEDEVFDPSWNHPRILAAVAHVLSGPHRLVGVSSRGLRPGHGQQALHVDWGGQGTPGVWYGCHAICALVDFTPRNGATRVVPGSHRNPHLLKTRMDPRKPHPAEQRLIGPAGTVFILNIHCGHSAMQNDSDSDRLALFTHFSRCDSPLLSMGADAASPSAQTLARHPADIRRLLAPGESAP